MPKVFFLSYARPRHANPDGLETIDRFARDLERAVSERVGGGAERTGFRDLCSIEAGTPDWAQELAQQIGEHPVGVVLLSPDYLQAERGWCRWEWCCLAARNAFASRVAAGPAAPRLLLPVNWVTMKDSDRPENFPPNVQWVGDSATDALAEEDLQAIRVANRRGLSDLVELAVSGDPVAAPQYRRVLLALAELIREQWLRHQALLPRGLDWPLPQPYDPQDRWAPARRTHAAGVPLPRRERRRKVFVFYAAAHPQEVRAVAPHRAGRYEAAGESDWRAFAIDPVGDEAIHVGALVAGLQGVEVEKLPWNYLRRQLDEALQEAARGPHPVLAVVDPWTVTQLAPYLDKLRDFARAERKLGLFAVPVVIWNDADPDLREIAPAFAQKVERLFDRTRWQRVRRVDELEPALSDVLRVLHRNIQNARADALPMDAAASMPTLNAN